LGGNWWLHRIFSAALAAPATNESTEARSKIFFNVVSYFEALRYLPRAIRCP